MTDFEKNSGKIHTCTDVLVFILKTDVTTLIMIMMFMMFFRLIVNLVLLIHG